MKVYLPDFSSYECVVVKNSDTIRAYRESPSEGVSVSYRDYFIHSDYYYLDSEEVISEIPVCIAETDLTDNFYYRVDFFNILIILLILSIFCFLIPIKIFIRLFRRFQ